MSGQDAAALVRAAHEAFNARDFDRVEEIVAADFEHTNVATGETFHGPEGMKRFERGWIQAFSDAGTEIVGLHGGDDFAVVEFIGRGIHDGPLASPGGEIPPTGRRIETRFCEVFEARDGRLVRGRIYFDLATMLGQLGLMPAPEAAEA